MWSLKFYGQYLTRDVKCWSYIYIEIKRKNTLQLTHIISPLAASFTADKPTFLSFFSPLFLPLRRPCIHPASALLARLQALFFANFQLTVHGPQTDHSIPPQSTRSNNLEQAYLNPLIQFLRKQIPSRPVFFQLAIIFKQPLLTISKPHFHFTHLDNWIKRRSFQTLNTLIT